MVDWNTVIHDYLWFCGIVLNLILAVTIFGFAGYGIYRVFG